MCRDPPMESDSPLLPLWCNKLQTNFTKKKETTNATM